MKSPIATLTLLGLMVSHAAATEQDRPNLLVIMANDCTYNDLPLYGGENAKTPNIDRLADEGLVFHRAYLSEAMCQPCRAELYTGQFPMRNGCAWNHSASRTNTRSLPHHLKPLGYRVGIAGKVHVRPETAFPFEKVAGFDANCVRNPTQDHDLRGMTDFITRDPRQPFCLVVCLVDPHLPWVMGDASQYPPNQLKLPPNIADTPQTRGDFSAYLAEITYMDSQVGDILGALEASGKAEDTLVLFTSEQGAQFPGCKWTNWDTGLHTALVARWPGVIAAGRRTDAIVQYADIVPTFLEVAGGNPAKSETLFDGTSFAGVLRGEKQQHRRFAYGVHNNIPEGPAYPIRTVTDGAYRYIRNLTPEEIYIEKHVMGFDSRQDYWPSWVAGASNDLRTYTLVKRYLRRPTEQLYHTAEDEYELTNLADEPALAAVKARLSAELDRWLHQQSDPGVPEDTPEAYRAAAKGDHLYGPPQTTGSTARWSAEKANQWYARQPWPCGFNYIPANAISYTEMWMPYCFNADLIDKELALAEAIGFNCARVVLPFVVWEHDPAAFKKRLSTFLDICDKRGIKVMVCLADDCAFGSDEKLKDPWYGKQPEVLEGWYANGWTPSPGHGMVRDPKTWPRLEKYTKDILASFKDDPRVWAWDLYNEPTSGGLGDASLPLLTKMFDWARRIGPSQPLTVAQWNGNKKLNDILFARSDIITFHNYNDAKGLARHIQALQEHGRPIINTEWLNRGRESVVATCLPVFKRESVGCMHWGLVNGKTQTHLAWGWRPGKGEPERWQHDLYHSDHTPYDTAELDLFRKYIKESENAPPRNHKRNVPADEESSP